MDNRLYNKTITCPVCNVQIEVTKIKLKACKPISRESDFQAVYEDLNPLHYEIWVCGNCGYAAPEEKFETVSIKHAKLIRSVLAGHWNKRAFAGERTADNAIEAFKLALYTAKIREAKPSELARYCIRIAWLYRIIKDSHEMDYLKFARKCYEEAYEKERFPVEKLDEYTCLYMVAELYRRTGSYKEAVTWFGRLITSSGARSKPQILNMARDQVQLAKDQLKESGDLSITDDLPNTDDLANTGVNAADAAADESAAAAGSGDSGKKGRN